MLASFNHPYCDKYGWRQFSLITKLSNIVTPHQNPDKNIQYKRTFHENKTGKKHPCTSLAPLPGLTAKVKLIAKIVPCCKLLSSKPKSRRGMNHLGSKVNFSLLQEACQSIKHCNRLSAYIKIQLNNNYKNYSQLCMLRPCSIVSLKIKIYDHNNLF